MSVEQGNKIPTMVCTYAKQYKIPKNRLREFFTLFTVQELHVFLTHLKTMLPHMYESLMDFVTFLDVKYEDIVKGIMLYCESVDEEEKQ